MDLKVRTQAFLGSGMSWLGSAHAVDTGEGVELDLSLFDFTTNFPNGFIPAGVVLAKVTATGKYGHYDAGVGTNEVQSMVATGGTVGDFTMAFEGGPETAPIAWNATAAQVQSALLALPNFNSGDIVCTGGPLPTTPVVMTFGGQYAGQNVPLIIVTDNITNGTATITVTTPGSTSGASTGGAGLEDAAGFLLFAIDVSNTFSGVAETTGVRNAAMLTHGKVRVSKLPANNGLDGPARTAMKLIRFI